MAVIALGADHAGFSLKENLKSWLTDSGHRVLDFGTHSGESVDYPDYAAAVGMAVAKGEADRGVLVCGTGIGMAIAANKIAGVRAAQCADSASAQISRQHNDTNVVTLGARTTPPETAVEIVKKWLDTGFEGGRHSQRIEKVTGLERTWSNAPTR